MNGKMIDAPIVSRAQTMLLMAERLGLRRSEAQ
jgi:citrate lyase beta subunit